MSGIIIKWLQFHIYDVYSRLTCMEWINLLCFGNKRRITRWCFTDFFHSWVQFEFLIIQQRGSDLAYWHCLYINLTLKRTQMWRLFCIYINLTSQVEVQGLDNIQELLIEETSYRYLPRNPKSKRLNSPVQTC